MSKKKKPNPHCPVPGCRTPQPHASDKIGKALVQEFSPPAKMTSWALGAMAELRNSICQDLQEGRLLAFYTGLRLPEELYIRVLYALFIASPEELPHILSGETPNDLSNLYTRVNSTVFEGRGPLHRDLGGFRPIDTLNHGAHASFQSFLTVIGWVRKPKNVPALDKYRAHLTTYCNNLNYMRAAFESGKSKEDILVGVKNLHRPASHGRSSNQQT